MRVVVIGGGIAGVSIAHELAEAASVVLVEQEAQLAHHTTGRSAAMYLQSYGGPVVRALTAASRDDFDRLADELGTPPLLRPRRLLWHAGDDGAAQELRAAVEDLEPVEVRTADEAVELFPPLRPERTALAAEDRSAREIDVLALHHAYVRGLRARGGDIVRSARAGIRRDGSGWRVTSGSHPGWPADVVVDAAGAWADELAEAAGVRPVGLRALRRTICTSPVTGWGDVDAWPLLIDSAERWYVKPEGADQVIASPADETPSEPCDARADEADVALGLQRVNEVTRLALRSVRASWAGLRTFAPDRSPVVGWRDDEPGFCWFAGQGGYGIQMAPALARLGAARVLGRPVPPDVADRGVGFADVSPDRFGARRGAPHPDEEVDR